jgi:hypothetical protein
LWILYVFDGDELELELPSPKAQALEKLPEEIEDPFVNINELPLKHCTLLLIVKLMLV